VVVGELQVWDLVNDTLMAHPFHLHGLSVQVLAWDGRRPAFRSSEDAVNVPAQGCVRIA
jgi:FtsP/CotA-like multicopper oxidase with cupredoxin domain